LLADPQKVKIQLRGANQIWMPVPLGVKAILRPRFVKNLNATDCEFSR